MLLNTDIRARHLPCVARRDRYRAVLFQVCPAKWVVHNITSEYVREYHPLAARTPPSSPGPPRPDDARPADLLGAVRWGLGAHRLRRLAVPLSALPRRRAGRRLPAAARPHRAPAQGPPPACRRTAH